jgi:lipopolysaccharide/colanic/teichoic acid biosynthesis glycosyltransferase
MSGSRVVDILAAVSGLWVLSPIFILLGILVRVSMGSPVIFRQQRAGWKGKLFIMYKFRTMSDCRSPDEKLTQDAERLTDLGRWMRKWSLDELPELLNVLKGDMALVGPRPLLPQYLDRYTPEQARRHEAIPGITGWAQVNGRNAITWEEKFKLDVWYVDNRSFRLDLKILWMTLAKVFRREGISQEDQATMEEFMGSDKPRGD